jgi:hypothetical protein
VRRILISLVFFLLFIFFFASAKQNAALADCASLGGTCMSGACPVGYTQAPGSDSTTCNVNGLYTCCVSNTPTQGAIKAGSIGCSLKTDGTPVAPLCESGAICIPGAYTSFDPGSQQLKNNTCISTQSVCPICDQGYDYIASMNKCQNRANAQDTKAPVRVDRCQSNQSCSPGYGCGGEIPSTAPLSICQNNTCQTALGALPTTLSSLLTTVFSIALSIAGVIALMLIIISGYRLMLSQGNPEQVKNARDQLTAAILGLLFIIFSLVILQVISANLLKIPGFG